VTLREIFSELVIVVMYFMCLRNAQASKEKEILALRLGKYREVPGLIYDYGHVYGNSPSINDFSHFAN
jgi:hypothetical protein